MIDFNYEISYFKSRTKRKRLNRKQLRNKLKKFEGTHIGYRKAYLTFCPGSSIYNYKHSVPFRKYLTSFFSFWEGRDFNEACKEFFKKYKNSRTKYKVRDPKYLLFKCFLTKFNTRSWFYYPSVYDYSRIKNNFGAVESYYGGVIQVLSDGTIKYLDQPRIGFGYSAHYQSDIRLRRVRKKYSSWNKLRLENYLIHVNDHICGIQPFGELYVVDLKTKKVIPEPKMTYLISVFRYTGKYGGYMSKLSAVLANYERVGIAGENSVGLLHKRTIYYTLIKK